MSAPITERCGLHDWFGHECDLVRHHLDDHESLTARGEVHTSWPAPRCRSDYHTDTRQHPFSQTNGRVVHCGLPKGHDGDHDEMLDGEPGIATWPQRKLEPRTWTLPPEPGPEVTAVRDHRDRVWTRHPEHPAYWQGRHITDENGCYPEDRTDGWPELLAWFGPLTDASAEATS